MKSLIVNADDFGYSSEVNAAIEAAMATGVVTSTTVLANMPCAEGARALLQRRPEASVGLHVNLTEGRPLSPPERVRSLTDAQGSFLPLGQLARRLWRGSIEREHLITEIGAQADRLASVVPGITHIDSHHHVHLFSQVLEPMLEVASRHGIQRVRTHRPYYIPSVGRSSSQLGLFLRHARSHRTAPLGVWLRARQRRLVRRYGFRTPGYMLYAVPAIKPAQTEQALAAWLRVLPLMPHAALEINCHPGRAEGDSALFTAPQLKDAVERYGVTLLTYHRV